MTDESTREPIESLSADQRALAEYFETDTYKNWMASRANRPARAWVLDLMQRDDAFLSPGTSYRSGLLGLSGILLFFAVLMPLEIELAESVMRRSRGYVQMTMFIQFMAFPPMIAFSFATVTPMFWYGPLLVRFASGALMVIPGYIGFYVALMLVDESPPDDFWYGFSAVLFAQFLTAGAVALTVQMWSPWTLAHHREPGTSLPPLGTREMMELTGIAAIGFAIFVSIDTGGIVEGMLFFTGVGFLTSVAVIGILIAFLRRTHRSVVAAIVSAMGAFATALLLCSFFAIAEFGWDSILNDFLVVGLASLFGAIVIYAVMWLCLWWLKSCGWECVSREEERRAAQALRDASGQ